MQSTSDPSIPSRLGGVILCGGMSRRMGMAKADLPFGAETMLQRMVRIVSEVYSPLVVVTAFGQTMPSLSADVVVQDRVAGLGPLEGMAVGLAAMPKNVPAALITSCDLPLLNRSFMRALGRTFPWNDPSVQALLIRDEERLHPLPGIYRGEVVTVIESMLAEQVLRVGALAERITVREMTSPATEFASEDNPLRNVNRWEDYVAALASARVTVDPDVLRRLQSLAGQQ